MKVSGIGSRKGSETYFFDFTNGIFVRCGCWFSSIDEFKERVKEKNADPLYIIFCTIVESNFYNTQP